MRPGCDVLKAKNTLFFIYVYVLIARILNVRTILIRVDIIFEELYDTALGSWPTNISKSHRVVLFVVYFRVAAISYNPQYKL